MQLGPVVHHDKTMAFFCPEDYLAAPSTGGMRCGLASPTDPFAEDYKLDDMHEGVCDAPSDEVMALRGAGSETSLAWSECPTRYSESRRPSVPDLFSRLGQQGTGSEDDQKTREQKVEDKDNASPPRSATGAWGDTMPSMLSRQPTVASLVTSLHDDSLPEHNLAAYMYQYMPRAGGSNVPTVNDSKLHKRRAPEGTGESTSKRHCNAQEGPKDSCSAQSDLCSETNAEVARRASAMLLILLRTVPNNLSALAASVGTVIPFPKESRQQHDAEQGIQYALCKIQRSRQKLRLQNVCCAYFRTNVLITMNTMTQRCHPTLTSRTGASTQRLHVATGSLIKLSLMLAVHLTHSREV